MVAELLGDLASTAVAVVAIGWSGWYAWRDRSFVGWPVLALWCVCAVLATAGLIGLWVMHDG